MQGQTPPLKLPWKYNPLKIVTFTPFAGCSPLILCPVLALGGGESLGGGGEDFTPITCNPPLLGHHQDPAASWVAQRQFAGLVAHAHLHSRVPGCAGENKLQKRHQKKNPKETKPPPTRGTGGQQEGWRGTKQYCNSGEGMKALLGRCGEPRASREEDAGGIFFFFSGHSWWQLPRQHAAPARCCAIPFTH